MADAPMDLYIATYSDPGAAQQDWDDIKQLARDGVITVDGLVLSRRRQDRREGQHPRCGQGSRAGGGGWCGHRPHLPAGVSGVGRCRRRGRRPRRRDPRPQAEEGDQGRHRGRAPRRAARASWRCSRSAGPRTWRRRSRSPTRSPSTRSTPKARRTSRQPPRAEKRVDPGGGAAALAISPGMAEARSDGNRSATIEAALERLDP